MLHNRNRRIIKKLAMKKQRYNDTKTEKKNSTKIENTKTTSLLNIDEKIPNKIPENVLASAAHILKLEQYRED